ncbi:MAG: AAA family ATPase [Myxococcota bacterium]
MYLRTFGLRNLPFETVSNATVYVDLPEHREAFNTILFGLRSGEGFVKVVGEVGTGKTALCRNLLAVVGNEFVSVYLPNPALSRFDLLLAIADELGVPVLPEDGVHRLHKLLREILLDVARQGRRVVIFADEAQAMPEESLEELRLLSNLESNRGKLAQVVLFGQPELDVRLSSYSLRQLQQRIAWSARLTPLDRPTCRAYIRSRLAAAGAPRPDTIFTPAAIDRIHRASSGIPRLINTLCHKSLLAAVSGGDCQVGRRHVGRALADTEGIQRWRTRPLFRSRATRRPASSVWSSLGR